jgi:hypothetical protein
MPTSLVSTGVQFPDNSIQTTAVSPAAIAVVQTVTANNTSANVDLPSCFTSTYTRYIIQVSRLVMSNNFVTITILFTNNNGSSYQGITGSFSSQITSNGGQGALGMNFSVDVSNPRDTSAPTVCFLSGLYFREGNQPQEGFSTGGTFRTSTDGATGFRVRTSSGTWVSGQVKVWGLT